VTRTEAGVAITWQAAPGKSYRIQFKDDLSDPVWNNLTGDIVAHGLTANRIDTTLGGQQRFYRVQLLD